MESSSTFETGMIQMLLAADGEWRVQVCTREPEISAVFTCQWLLDVRSDTVGDV